ncbi:hypothetical protein LTR36_003596 [Oleoguttula mirabilis]|uniref:SURF6-domain-containing protein n=1 Tax=Oleoguttula mirabilis TaxID=1507867 RepID=A0AAV9JI44_9PEZI|nr:hypothetical protein LTR36_003596 [Oleoguttula mirabilis]
MEDSTDIMDGLEERLQSHAKAFESLLALTPAREYYGSQIVDGQDPSEQWNRKKQTKEQKRAAKKAKLDPANQKSALDVMKERERKRKRELGMEDEAGEKVEGGDGADKRQKVEDGEDASEAKRREKADKRKEKRQVKKEKIAKKQAKAEAKKAAKQDRDLEEAQAEGQQGEKAADEDGDEGDAEPEHMQIDAELDAFDASGFSEEPAPALTENDADDDLAEASSVPSSPAVDSPAFDTATNHSTASSSSSIVPPSTTEQPTQPKQPKQAPSKPTVDTDQPTTAPADAPPKRLDPVSGTSSPRIQLPNIDQEQLQERLRQRIEELRAKRKADGPDGKPAKSRQELLDQRRKKEEQRKATKKDQRRKAKDEEDRKREEQLRAGSGSPMSADIFSPGSPRPQENSFSFSRLAFEDGTSADAGLTGLNDPRKKKGPQDPRTALEAAQKKQARISGLDDEKRADIAEKDLWLNAKKRAHGERVRDDTSLLKKALKRKEKQKGKSGKEWQEREQAVVHGKEMKQKKRDTNLAKRKEEKGGGSKGKKKGGAPKGGKKKARPGFEGRFKA